jgi:hypothetical protein
MLIVTFKSMLSAVVLNVFYECHYTKWHFVECHCAKCHYTECCNTLYTGTGTLVIGQILLIIINITDKDFYRKICQNLPELNAIKLSFLSSMRLLLNRLDCLSLTSTYVPYVAPNLTYKYWTRP